MAPCDDTIMALAGKYERMRHEDPTLVLKVKEVSGHHKLGGGQTRFHTRTHARLPH